eukprot:12636-Heterococcus_DN1.PRE.2
MKTACATTAALALVASASAFVAPAASARVVCFEHCSSLLAVARADAVLLLMLQLSLLFTGCVTMSAAPEGRRAFASKAAVALVGLTTFAQGASAAKYFGDKASASATALMFDRCATAAQRYNRKTQMDYPEVLKPENAVKDDETFGSSEQQQQQQQQCSWRLAV